MVYCDLHVILHAIVQCAVYALRVISHVNCSCGSALHRDKSYCRMRQRQCATFYYSLHKIEIRTILITVAGEWKEQLHVCTCTFPHSMLFCSCTLADAYGHYNMPLHVTDTRSTHNASRSTTAALQPARYRHPILSLAYTPPQPQPHQFYTPHYIHTYTA